MDLFLLMSGYVVLFVAVMFILVAVHEFGHFIAARALGLSMQEFSVGFGPLVATLRDRDGMRYSLRLLPLGGYVRFTGGEVVGFEEKGKQPTDSEGTPGVRFADASLWRRSAVVQVVAHDSPAQRAGLLANDRIVAIDGREISNWSIIAQHVRVGLDAPVAFTVERPLGEEMASLTMLVHPEIRRVLMVDGSQVPVGWIGAEGGVPVLKRYSLDQALPVAADMTARWMTAIGTTVMQVIDGDRQVSEFSGPVGIAVVAQRTLVSDVGAIFLLIAALSLNLGLLNLVPVPGLDGGHLAFYAYEGVVRRSLPLAVQRAGIVAGIGAAVLFMIVVSYHDIRDLWNVLG